MLHEMQTRSIILIIIIIERKDLGGVMSKRLQGHLTNAKNSSKTRVRRDENSVRPSVCPSVKCMHYDKTEEKSVQIFIPCEREFSLVF